MSRHIACFLSYCHGQNELVASFVDQFARALRNYLEPRMDGDVYVDRERLRPGYEFNEALAQAICRSTCMIVVYSPRYEASEYCRREFAAMRKIEDLRRSALGDRLQGRRMLIPVILRGDRSSLPPQIREATHYADFSRFGLWTQDISHHAEFGAEVDRICSVIHEIDEILTSAKAELSKVCDCARFALPPPCDAPRWRQDSTGAEAVFPGRLAARG